MGCGWRLVMWSVAVAWITAPLWSTSRFVLAVGMSIPLRGSAAPTGRVVGWLFFHEGPAGPILRAVRRGILGGTFDPPHLAHLVAGEAAYRQLGLDVVTFVPAGAPWQKASQRVTDAEDRWAMTRLAVEGVAYFEADDREVHRPGWTYTIDTIDSFDATDELCLILGADAALGLPTWHRASEVLERAHIAVAPRPGCDRAAIAAVLDGTSTTWLAGPEMLVSGTVLRAMASTGSSLRFLVPEPVWRYLEEHRLYGHD